MIKNIHRWLIIGTMLFLGGVQYIGAEQQVYCSMRYMPFQRVIVLNVGDKLFSPCDEQGNPLNFNTQIEAFNYLGQLGWSLVPITIGTQSNDNAEYVFTKTISTNGQLMEGFRLSSLPNNTTIKK